MKRVLHKFSFPEFSNFTFLIEVAQIQEVTGRSAETEAQVPQNVV